MPEQILTVQPTMEALENRLKQPENLALLDAVVVKYQSNAAGTVYVRRGRAKVQDSFPCIALEIVSKKEPWGAIDFTKDITINVDVFAMVKVTGGKQSEKISLAVEDYIIELGETLQGILNERGMQQYDNIDEKGAKIYDSYAAEASYSYMYQGAVRAVKMPWFAKLWLFGPEGGNPPNFST